MNRVTAAPAWYGKLPSIGDFASRRLDAALLTHWDDWLATGMRQLRDELGTEWLQAYLEAPRRRFLLMPGVMPGAFGAMPWAGVLMPSVDRVGRYFPFTLIQPLGGLPATFLEMQQLWQWIAELESTAAQALQDDWPIERLEHALENQCAPMFEPRPNVTFVGPATVGDTEPVSVQSLDAATLLETQSLSLWNIHSMGLAHWFADFDNSSTEYLVSRGLPGSAAVLMGGQAGRGGHP